ncbi:MAG: hypothetical protein CMF36_07240 [Leeuwenhoekiella sp.]|nr:hypothetical protein [Leeuwenhoekiella sp.]MBA80910.1 hypothetical protein [Leeuwenhoekiella sp.]
MFNLKSNLPASINNSLEFAFTKNQQVLLKSGLVRKTQRKRFRNKASEQMLKLGVCSRKTLKNTTLRRFV